MNTLRIAVSCWVSRNRLLSLFGSFTLLMVLCFSAGLWASTHTFNPYAGQVTAVALVPLGMVAIWHAGVRRSMYGSSLELAPNYRPNASQVQIHLSSLESPFKLRKQVRSAIPNELEVMQQHGVRRVAMDSPLLADPSMRQSLVSNFNRMFDQYGMPWRAIDKGSEPSGIESFFFVLAHYKAAYLSDKFPTFYREIGLKATPPNLVKTFSNLVRDRSGKLLWGSIQFVAR